MNGDKVEGVVCANDKTRSSRVHEHTSDERGREEGESINKSEIYKLVNQTLAAQVLTYYQSFHI